MNILLVEDNSADILLAKEALKEGLDIPYTLNIVSDGEETLNYLYKEPPFQQASTPNLIFLDLNLPRMDGREVLKTIKGDETLKTVPVIVFSTSEASYDIDDSYRLHANCYLTKPVNYDEFVHVITSTIKFWYQIAKLPGTQFPVTR